MLFTLFRSGTTPPHPSVCTLGYSASVHSIVVKSNTQPRTEDAFTQGCIHIAIPV